VILTATSEDDVQRSVTTLNRVLQLYITKISEAKNKPLGLQSKWWTGIKVVINDTISEPKSGSNYLGRKISDKLNEDMESNIVKYEINGIVKNKCKGRLKM
jgi:hypothetical protein